jgi:hypothetical protein
VVVRIFVERDALKRTKKKSEYRQGREAQEAFEEMMKALFRAPKCISKKVKKGKD